MGSVTSAFITGIGGQDGSYLAEQLLADGIEVHGLARSTDDLELVPSGAVVHVGDVSDVLGVRRLLVELAPDQIYNLAALSSVAASWTEADLNISINAAAAAGLIETAWQVQEQRGHSVAFVQPSSAEIFGNPATTPQDEQTPIAPVNPYGAAKAFAHHMVGVYRSRGLHASSLVLYNHESPRRPMQFVTRKITATVAAIAQGTATDLVLGNTAARRDWGWAPDYVDAMVRAATQSEADDYVIATGRSHSVLDFVAAAFDRVGIADWQGLVRSDPALVRPVDAVELCGDPSKARTRLGWSPTVSFVELVQAMVDHDLELLR